MIFIMFYMFAIFIGLIVKPGDWFWIMMGILGLAVTVGNILYNIRKDKKDDGNRNL